jgi:hypothetical protein
MGREGDVFCGGDGAKTDEPQRLAGEPDILPAVLPRAEV